MLLLLRRLAFSALFATCAIFLSQPASAQNGGVPAQVWSLFGNSSTSPSAFLGTTDANSLRIGTNAIPRILISEDGAVQIGSVDNPSNLDIYGNLYVSGVVTGASGAHFGGANNATISSNGLLQFQGTGSYGVADGRFVFQTLSSGALTGIGLRSSGSALEVYSGSAVTLSVDYASGNTAIAGNAAVTGDASVGGNASITGNAAVTGNATVTANATINGNVGIGGANLDGANYALYINGRIRSNGINELSDRRMKQDVATLDGALATVLKLRGVRYQWLREEHPGLRLPSGEQIGLIAQEVEAVVPEVVLTDAEGVKSVEYSHLVAVLVEAVKEQQATIEGQARVLAEVQAELRGLRASLDRPAGGSAEVITTASTGLRTR